MSDMFRKLAEQAFKELAKSATAIIQDINAASSQNQAGQDQADRQTQADRKAEILERQPGPDIADLEKFGGSWEGVVRSLLHSNPEKTAEVIGFIERGEGSNVFTLFHSPPRLKAALLIAVPEGEMRQRAARVIYSHHQFMLGWSALDELLKEPQRGFPELNLTVADIEVITERLGWPEDSLLKMLLDPGVGWRRHRPLSAVQDLSTFLERDQEHIRAALSKALHSDISIWERLETDEEATLRLFNTEICMAVTANSTALREQVAPLFEKLTFEQAQVGLRAALDGAKPEQRAKILIAAHSLDESPQRDSFIAELKERLGKDRSRAVRDALDAIESGSLGDDLSGKSSIDERLAATNTPLERDALVAMTQREMAKKNAVSKRIAWLDLDTLPQVQWADGSLVQRETMDWFISDAARTQDTGPSELLAHHAPAMDTDSLSKLTSTLFWKFHAADEIKPLPGAKGLMGFIAIAPPPDVITAIDAYIRKHRGKRIPQSTAMLHLLGHAENSRAIGLLLSFASHRNRKVREAATNAVSELVERRGFTPAQLADRFVPDGGFSADGKLTFAYGSRSFTATLADDLSVLLADDESGRTYKSLPKGRANDDGALVTEAKQRWAIAKKDLDQIDKMQPLRLHEAMCAERTWSWAEFDEHFLQHPVVLRLASRLVWLGAPAGSSDVAFRPLTDGTLLLANDDEFVPSPETLVRLAHSNFFPDTSLAWRNHIADYEVTPLFAQFDRPRIEPSSAHDFVDFDDFTFQDKGVASFLMARNWKASYDAYESVSIVGFEKTMATIPLSVSIKRDYSRAQAPGSSRTYALFSASDKRRRLRLRNVPPIALSEIAADLRAASS